MKTIDEFGCYWTALLNRRRPPEASPGDHASPRVLPQSVAWPTLYDGGKTPKGASAFPRVGRVRAFLERWAPWMWVAVPAEELRRHRQSNGDAWRGLT